MKVGDYVFPQGTSPELLDFLDAVQAILNNGRYQLRVISEEPTWETHEGEFLIQRDDANGISRLWYFDETWHKLEFNSSSKALEYIRLTTLTYTEPIVTDVSEFNRFRITLKGSTTLSNPIGTENVPDGKMIIYEFTQDAVGDRVLTFDSGFSFGVNIPEVVLSTTAGYTDLVGCMYQKELNVWRICAFMEGYAV